MPSSIPPAVPYAGLVVIVLLAVAVAALLRERRAMHAARETQKPDPEAASSAIPAQAAHTINNALAGIQYSFLLLKDSIPADHPYFSSVAAIEREIKRIAAVTRQQ
jgi:nitrogen-specific signal transduction histidine kinase